jgi:DNA-binding LacI/PurR family transcriptional regulator
MQEKSSPSNTPQRIGFVVDWIDEFYQTTVLKGAAQVAESNGAELIVLPGGVIGAEHDHGASRNGLYRLIQADCYDGLVLMTGTLGNARGLDVSKDICPEFPKDRICHVAIDVLGSPSVLIDNKVGVRKAV